MYFKLALQNVKKSFKDYLIYFLTLAFAICLFYSFNSFQSQQAVMEMSEFQNDIIDLVELLMSMLSLFIAVVLGFLIIYANNFLIKRRKKELGLYMLLGMPKQQISKVLIYETFLIGLLSLIMGLIFGIIASQLLTIITANLFEAELHYAFVFSQSATILTICAFALIFFIIIIFNTLILNRYKLIDLLNADKKNEQLKVKNIYVSIVMFITSVALLGFTYWFALSQGINALNRLDVIAPCGILGTLLFFMSLSGFLLKFVQSSKSLYYRKLNMFVLRQVNASINSNYFSMSIVCIMLLFSIGALATGTNLNRTLNNMIRTTTPYDYTNTLTLSSDMENIEDNEIQQILNIDKTLTKSDSFVHVYWSDTALGTFQSGFENSFLTSNIPLTDENKKDFFDEKFEVIALSEFNELRRQYGMDEIALQEEEAYLFSSTDLVSDAINNILADKPSFVLYNRQLHIANDSFDIMNTGTTASTMTVSFALVVQDHLIPKDAKLSTVNWNVMLKEHVDQTAFAKMVDDQYNWYNETAEAQGLPYLNQTSSTASEVKENSKGLSVVMTYIGLYLGLVFLIASAVILALQQLSQASDNKRRYLILNKIGTEQKMIRHSVLLQLSIYFFMPLLLAVIHSIVGIQVVNSIVVAFGKSDIFVASIITAGMILVIYGAYFFVTYLGYKNILTKS